MVVVYNLLYFAGFRLLLFFFFLRIFVSIFIRDIGRFLCVCFGASQVALVVKNPSVNAGGHEMWIQFLNWEDPLEQGMTTHSWRSEVKSLSRV